MGLFDSIAGQVLGAVTGSAGGVDHGSWMDAIGGLLANQEGGLQGMVQAFQDKGLGGVVASWIGTGANLSISPEQLQSVLGNEQIAAIAGKFGFTPDQVASHLSELLPKVVDQLTPGGELPDGGALGGLLGMLKGGN